ncbi:MAG: amidase [Planctomycetota bacterium]|nr:amidase [Planctomycetota bacterium]
MPEIIKRVENALAVIDELDPRLHAWVLVDRDGALRAAEELTAEEQAGTVRGPLHGMPVGIKDIVDVRGMPARAGSTLTDDTPVDRDAPVVAALRKAGAVILGKTVTVEFACFDPSPTLNPWSKNLNHTPGGSSSGSAAAVATGMCEAAIGTQTGGSLVRPSSYCGIATCKPTFARVDRDGVFPVSHEFDHVGPMACTVAQLEAMLQCLPVSADYAPPHGAAAKRTARERAEAESQAFGAGHGPRLGLIEPFFMEVADETVRRITEETLERLREAGATVVSIDCNIDFTAVRPMHRLVMSVEAAAIHRQRFAQHREGYGPLITGLLDEGLQTPGVDFAEALERLRAYRRAAEKLLDGVDALIVPSTHTTAPPTLTTTGTPDFQAPWSCAGLPVVSMPCGLSEEGMPAAVQLVGPYHQDRRLLSIARWCETAIGFSHRPCIMDS